MTEPQQFKRGQRIRYVGHWFGRHGKPGKIIGTRPWIKVRFDGEEAITPCSASNLERVNRSAPK